MTLRLLRSSHAPKCNLALCDKLLTSTPRTIQRPGSFEAQPEALHTGRPQRRPDAGQVQIQASNLPSTSFSCRRVNSTTFLIIEDDSFSELPHIYVKIYPDVLFISDTGCNSPRDRSLVVTYLRQYIENYPISSNNDQPLNPQGRKGYAIIFSHCHYDHILGIEQFDGPNTTIVASGHSKSFILEDLPTHSLCKYLNIPTPLYEVTHWARNLEYLKYRNQATYTDIPLRIQTFHVPGHTPDSLAWYDIDEHHLYVGDTLYSNSPILFLVESNWISYQNSLYFLFEFVVRQNEILRQRHQYTSTELGKPPAPRVLISSGHSTLAADAESMISDVQSFFMRIIGNAIPVVESKMRFGEVFDLWRDEDEKAYWVWAPRRLAEEARRRIG